MKELINIFHAIMGALGTAFVYIFGGLDVALQCLLVAIALDYVTGIIKAYKSAKLDSKIGIKGILKKVGVLCLVALAVVIDKLTGESGLIRTAIIYYLVSNEGLSIIENLGEIGILVPEFLKQKLKQLQELEKEGE